MEELDWREEVGQGGALSQGSQQVEVGRGCALGQEGQPVKVGRRGAPRQGGQPLEVSWGCVLGQGGQSVKIGRGGEPGQEDRPVEVGRGVVSGQGGQPVERPAQRSHLSGTARLAFWPVAPWDLVLSTLLPWVSWISAWPNSMGVMFSYRPPIFRL